MKKFERKLQLKSTISFQLPILRSIISNDQRNSTNRVFPEKKIVKAIHSSLCSKSKKLKREYK